MFIIYIYIQGYTKIVMGIIINKKCLMDYILITKVFERDGFCWSKGKKGENKWEQKNKIGAVTQHYLLLFYFFFFLFLFIKMVGPIGNHFVH